jgi:hypothetical protein
MNTNPQFQILFNRLLHYSELIGLIAIAVATNFAMAREAFRFPLYIEIVSVARELLRLIHISGQRSKRRRAWCGGIASAGTDACRGHEIDALPGLKYRRAN